MQLGNWKDPKKESTVMPQDEDHTIAEDITTPVEIEPGSDHATPQDWN